jgi:hypothetical protein
MAYRQLELDSLVINRANDRHGELENETAAIAWLFNNRQQHMLALARDIAEKKEIYEPPLVYHDGSRYVVFDGNRRVTCLKLLQNPRRAPTVELQTFFSNLKTSRHGPYPIKIQCQVEADRDRIDDILFRRHTGSQNGIGQSTWDDRMKSNFIARTGKGTNFSVADEVERRLAAAGLAPTRRKIPRSTMNRLLSSEAFRNRVGISVNRGRFEFTHSEDKVLGALRRIANDLSSHRIVLGDIWDVDGKRTYLDRLEGEGLLPTAADSLRQPEPFPRPVPQPRPRIPAPPSPRVSLIPAIEYPVAWAGRIQRHRAIWEELQFHLKLVDHPNAISVLFRVLFELSVENYILQTGISTVKPNDNLATRALRVAEDFYHANKIDQKYLGVFKNLPQFDALFSMDTLNRYVHSPNFAPSPLHLTAMWDTVADFIVLCLNA